MATHSVLSPGESQGQRSLVGCSPWGRTELDTTEATQQQQQQPLKTQLGPLLLGRDTSEPRWTHKTFFLILLLSGA